MAGAAGVIDDLVIRLAGHVELRSPLDRRDLDRNLVALLNVTPDLTEDVIAFFGLSQRVRMKRWWAGSPAH